MTVESNLPPTGHIDHLAAQGAMQDPASTSPEHLARIVFLSYRYSQGAIGTQNRMLLYIEEHHQPDLFDQARIEEIREKAKSMIGPYFLNQTTHPATAIPWEDDSPEAAVKTDQTVTNEVEGLFARFSGEREEIAGFESTPPAIAESVIVMDHDYITRPGGRAGDSEQLKIKVSPYARDPYDSLFIKHAIKGETTTSPEFDDIFQKISGKEVLDSIDSLILMQLQEICDIYMANHPDLNNESVRLLKARCEEILNGRR